MPKMFSHKISPRVSTVGYTMGARIGKALLNILQDDNLFYESYIMVYGFLPQKVYTKINTLYLGTPYSRGYIFSLGATLSQTPVTLFLNLDSKCLRRDIVEKAIETVVGGYNLLYIAIPFTGEDLTALYRDNIYIILKDLSLGSELLYPSYTLVVGKTRIFKDASPSLWGSEVLAALLTELTSGRISVKIDNTECMDRVPQALENLGEIYMGRLLRDIVSMLLSRKVIDENQSREYLKMMGDDG